MVHANSAGTPVPVDEMQNLELPDRPIIVEYHYDPGKKDSIKSLSYVVHKN